jgi:lysyl-tRNA synthetase class I
MTTLKDKYEPYLFNSGIKKLAKEVKGSEKIHIGIRPFGFHAGNLLSLYVYPYLFCEEVKRLGKPVNFIFFCSINDYEQDELDGPDYQKYPFNIYPKNTTLGYSRDSAGCHEFIIDHWLPIIKKSILKLKEAFPDIQVYFVKNSELKGDLKFKEILTSTLKNPGEHADIYRRFTDKEILPSPIQYAGVVCPVCKKTKGITQAHRINSEFIRWDCGVCGISLNAPYSHYDYWFYHKPLFTARLCIFNIDITFSGGDHYNEGDFEIRKEFIKRFNPGLVIPKMFFAPTLLTGSGDRMSKSRKNTQFGNPKELINYCRDIDCAEIRIQNNLIVHPEKDEEYLNFF